MQQLAETECTIFLITQSKCNLPAGRQVRVKIIKIRGKWYNSQCKKPLISQRLQDISELFCYHLSTSSVLSAGAGAGVVLALALVLALTGDPLPLPSEDAFKEEALTSSPSVSTWS